MPGFYFQIIPELVNISSSNVVNVLSESFWIYHIINNASKNIFFVPI